MIDTSTTKHKKGDVNINIREKQLKDAMLRKKELESKLKFADEQVSKFADGLGKSLRISKSTDRLTFVRRDSDEISESRQQFILKMI